MATYVWTNATADGSWFTSGNGSPSFSGITILNGDVAQIGNGGSSTVTTPGGAGAANKRTGHGASRQH
jgi:hypothetical protein